MRFLALFLPRLATDRIKRRLDPTHRHPKQSSDAYAPRGSPEGREAEPPHAVVAKIKGATRITALDLQAARLGLKVGAALADARAMFPALVIHEANPAADADTLLALTDWCRLFTPLAAPDAPDGTMLDISGAAHLFGGEGALLDRMVLRLGHQGFSARAAIAGSPGAAWALARHGGTRRLIPEAMSESERMKLFAPMPLTALRLDSQAIARFGQAGLRRVGDLVLRPRAPIVARFGPDVFHRLDALLVRTHPISPRFEAPAFVAERRYAEGIVHREAIEGTILALCHDLCGLLARHGEGARQLDASLFRVDGVVKHIEAGTSRPLRDPLTMARLFRERIESIGEEGLDTGYGFDVIRLSVLSAERLDQTQPGWDNGPAGTDVADLIDRLGARFGVTRVTRLVAIDTHVPERAAKGIAAYAVPPVPRRRSPYPCGEGLGVHQLAFKISTTPTPSLFPQGAKDLTLLPDHPLPDHPLPDHPLPNRPLRLLQHPEPIEAIAGIPDGPPMRFRWRRVLHQVAAIEGPERIGPEWWKSSALPRDYFRAEDTAGQRFWLFREGLYPEAGPQRDQAAQPDDAIPDATRKSPVTPNWFIHGLFA